MSDYILGCLQVGKKGMHLLEEDIHTASTARLTSKTLLKPQTSKICWARIKNSTAFQTSETYQILPVEQGHIANEPGLMVTNSIGNSIRQEKFQYLLLTTQTKLLIYVEAVW